MLNWKFDGQLLYKPSEWKRCIALCIKENKNGCCGIDEEGCYWRPGSEVVRGNFSGVAVTCKGGENYL